MNRAFDPDGFSSSPRATAAAILLLATVMMASCSDDKSDQKDGGVPTDTFYAYEVEKGAATISYCGSSYTDFKSIKFAFSYKP